MNLTALSSVCIHLFIYLFIFIFISAYGAALHGSLWGQGHSSLVLAPTWCAMVCPQGISQGVGCEEVSLVNG